MFDKFTDSWLKELGFLVAVGFIGFINGLPKTIKGVLYVVLIIAVVANHIWKQRKVKNLPVGGVIGPDTKIIGTNGFNYTSKEVSKTDWADIAAAGRKDRDKNYLVELYHEQHVRYKGRKLDSYSVKITFVNLGSEPCNEAILKLYPLLLKPDTKRDGLYQRVEVDISNKDNEAAEDFTDVTLPETPHHVGGVRALTFAFPNGISSKKGATLCLNITPEYVDDEQWRGVTDDNTIRADNRAIQKLVVTSSFTEDSLPENVHPLIIRFRGGLKGHYPSDGITKIDHSYSMTYYGVALQEFDSFSYGMCWGWRASSH